MKKILGVLFILVLANTIAKAQYNNWAIGFQLVEPSGLNIRKYYGDNKAFDVSVGTYGLFYGRDRSYRQGSYHNAGWSARIMHLWHRPIFKSDRWRTSYGFGGQINSRRYYFPSRNTPNILEYDATLSLGGAGQAGLEYFLPNSPLSAFADVGLYVEILPAPFFIHPLGSIGVRYNF